MKWYFLFLLFWSLMAHFNPVIFHWFVAIYATLYIGLFTWSVVFPKFQKSKT